MTQTFLAAIFGAFTLVCALPPQAAAEGPEASSPHHGLTSDQKGPGSELVKIVREATERFKDVEVAKRCLDLGLVISLAGPVTYKNARALPDVARFVPADRLVVETDCPFLPPHPHRGPARPDGQAGRDCAGGFPAA